MPDFNEVGLAVLSERRYQDSKWKDNLDKTNSIPEYLKYMQTYLDAAKAQIQEGTTVLDILATIRKVTALGVVTMEKFGAPHREGFECDPFNDNGCAGVVACPSCPMDDRCEITQDEAVELTPNELDGIIAQEQEAIKVERGVYYRVSETERIYVFDDPSAEHHFTDVRAFAVMPSGGHRLLDKYGTWFYVQPGWRVLIVPKAEVV